MGFPFWRVQNGTKLHLTLGGIYNYDNTLFDDIVIPDNADKDVLITEILRQSAGNESRYQSPKLLKRMIENFFKTNEWKFSELWKTTEYEYDPLVNYDLEISETREREENNDRTRNVESIRNSTGTSKGTVKEGVSAYNVSDYSPKSKTDSDGTITNNGTGSETETENSKGDGTESIIRREKGDNSARSTQYMIKEQREIVDFNWYQIVANEFEDELTIPIYYRTGVNVF